MSSTVYKFVIQDGLCFIVFCLEFFIDFDRSWSVFSGAGSNSDIWNVGCILIPFGSSSLNVIGPSFS